MDKNVTDNLIMTPSAANAQSLQSATGNPRNKCALKPGHSLMDWIRLGNSGVDLSGTGGRVIPVTKQELAKHNTIKDAWMAIRGVVYNVTHYMEFHPGGVEELMRGVGSDATKLFNETHAWVNYSQLLNKCRIGPLTYKADTKNEKSLSNPFLPPKKPLLPPDIVPRLDWIQKRDDVTLYFYTKQFSNPGSVIRQFSHEDCPLEIWIIIGVCVHKFEFELRGRINWPPKKINISTESGKIEITLNKHDDHTSLWNGLGNYKMSKILATDLELEAPLEFTMFSKQKFNNDSFVMLFTNKNFVYFPPVGYHLAMEIIVNGKPINKCYTPVPKSYTHQYVTTEAGIQCIYFLIKCYPNPNNFPQHLCNLEKDATIKASLPKGNLKLSTLVNHRRFCFLAAGSGLTPFLSLVEHLLNRNTNRIETIKLFYFNKTLEDIWCNDVLTNMSSKDGRFEVVNILSRANESWCGLKGRVSSELLFSTINNSMQNHPFIAACGPPNFITNVQKIVNEFNFPNENLFIF